MKKYLQFLNESKDINSNTFNIRMYKPKVIPIDFDMFFKTADEILSENDCTVISDINFNFSLIVKLMEQYFNKMTMKLSFNANQIHILFNKDDRSSSSVVIIANGTIFYYLFKNQKSTSVKSDRFIKIFTQYLIRDCKDDIQKLYEIMNKYFNIDNLSLMDIIKNYDVQKKLLDNDITQLEGLKKIGLDPKIQEEYKDILKQSEWT